MKGFSKNIVAAGLAGALSLGMVACSSTTTTTTTIETSTTDEDGNTTTTTDTKTQTTTTGGESSTVHMDYLNDYFGIGFNYPEGFSKQDKASDVEGVDVELYATDDKGSEIWIMLYNNITDLDNVTDEASWAKSYAALMETQLTDEGETDIKTSIDSATIGDGIKATNVAIESKKDGETVYRQIILTVDDENSGLAFLFKTSDQATLQEMNNNLLSYTLV